MKRVYIICCSAVVLSFLILGCGDSHESPQKQEPPKALGADKNTGFSQDSVDAQLKIGIYSPYQLIKATEYSVEPIRSEDFTLELLRTTLNEKISEIMPTERSGIRDEIVNYLVKYYMKNPT